MTENLPFAIFKFGFLFSLQKGDSYLMGLSARYAQELGTSIHQVLQQLEDLRLAEWSDHAPPPPSVPNGHSSHYFVNPVDRTYVNMANNRGGNHSLEPIYVPGQYQVRLERLRGFF